MDDPIRRRENQEILTISRVEGGVQLPKTSLGGEDTALGRVDSNLF